MDTVQIKPSLAQLRPHILISISLSRRNDESIDATRARVVPPSIISPRSNDHFPRLTLQSLPIQTNRCKCMLKHGKSEWSPLSWWQKRVWSNISYVDSVSTSGEILMMLWRPVKLNYFSNIFIGYWIEVAFKGWNSLITNWNYIRMLYRKKNGQRDIDPIVGKHITNVLFLPPLGHEF